MNRRRSQRPPPRSRDDRQGTIVSIDAANAETLRDLVRDNGGRLDVVMVDLSTREHILALPPWLHALVSCWMGWWQEQQMAIPCLVCAGQTAPFEGLPPAIVLLRGAAVDAPRLDAAGWDQPPNGANGGPGGDIEAQILVQGMCADCAQKPNTQELVYAEVRRSLGVIQIDPAHFIHDGGRA